MEGFSDQLSSSSALNIKDSVELYQDNTVKAAGLMGLQTVGRPFLGQSLDPAKAGRMAGPASFALVAETLVSGFGCSLLL